MQSKISCFNLTIYRKNLTRFAPVWGLYTLCLTLGALLVYSNGGDYRQFHFANHYITDMFPLMAVLNLGYGLLVAQLLFGDLFSSRMCNMLHAFPITRESWFFTNVLSGLSFSLIPTGVMALVSAPMLMGSIFEGAAALAFWVFLAANLEFLCCFSLAVFAAMCTGTRFTMAAGYGLLHGGAMITYWLIDTVYTPMLRGVITPTALMWDLTPMYHMSEHRFVDTDVRLYTLRQEFGEHLQGAKATFFITDQWWHLWLVAGVGIAFLLLALIFYKKRDLECAGDAVAFRWLVPVFEVLCAVFVATAVRYFLEHYLDMTSLKMLTLFIGLVVGWFVGKMLVEHSTRVFRLANFRGLVLLATVFGISLGLTKLDVLGIETYRPQAAKVKNVYFETNWTPGRTVDSPADIEAMLALHADALEQDVENSGTYVRGFDGSWVQYVDTNDHLYEYEEITVDNRLLDNADCTFAANVGLTYELNNGKIIKRRYNIWVDSEAGRITNDYLNDWAELDFTSEDESGVKRSHLEMALEDFRCFNVDYQDERTLRDICFEKEAALELLDAIDKDLREGRMAQHPYFHTGALKQINPYSDDRYIESDSFCVAIQGENYSWSVSIYADARHTNAWLLEHGLQKWYVLEEKTMIW